MRRFLRLCLLVFICCSFFSATEAALQEIQYDSEIPPVLVEGAMGKYETAYMISRLENVTVYKIGSWEYAAGIYHGFPLVVCTTDVGMENAAAATAFGIEIFRPCAVINQGTAGGYSRELHQKDIVVAVRTFNAAAFMTEYRNIGEGADYRYGEYFRYGEKDIYHAADSVLLQKARAAAPLYKEGRVTEGVLASSDNWNRQLDKILYLNEKYGVMAEEMEADSAAQICSFYKVPFIAIRILSNSELHDKETYLPETGEYCQRFVLQVVDEFRKH